MKVSLLYMAVVAGTCLCGGAQGQTNTSLMNVTRWRGTFTRHVSDAGSGLRDGCTVTWKVLHDVRVTSQLNLGQSSISHPTWRYWFSTNNLQQSIEVDEEYLEVCPNPGGDPDMFRIKATEDPEFPPEGFDLQIHSDRGTYTIGFPAGAFVNADLEISGSDGPPIPSVGSFAFDNAHGHIERPLPTNGMVLSGSHLARLPDVMMSTAVGWFFWNQFLSQNIEVTWHLEPVESEDVELVVMLPGYDNWRPEGSIDENTPGNSIGIEARLQRTDGNPPQTARVKKFAMELVSVSHEPGVCMNYPVDAASGGDPKPDLQFVSELNQDWTIDGGAPESLVMESQEGSYLVSPSAMMTSFDWGAYALLKVTAELVDGRILTGHLNGGSGDIRIPKRQDGSLIADAWKTAKGVSGLPDTNDSEGDPEGDGHPGDGLALYEEYRGFYEGGLFTHISGHPKKKDLFVRNMIGDTRGYVLAAAISGLEIHYRLAADEFPASRVINANHSAGAPHTVDQHGILVVRAPLDGPAGQACGGPSIPKHIVKIMIESTEPAVNDSGGVPWTMVRRNGKLILRDRFARLIAHELMHACNVWHHGRGDVRHQEWVIDRDQEGTLTFKEDDQVIRILRESGASIVPRPVTNLTMTVWLGVTGGAHSGNDDCVMRYDLADAYRSLAQPNVRYWVDGDEVAGSSLCNHKAGTGVNAAGRTPQPRYGDATNGDCLKQICVNDAMNHAPGGSCR